jgi:hypothetical protein
MAKQRQEEQQEQEQREQQQRQEEQQREQKRLQAEQEQRQQAEQRQQQEREAEQRRQQEVRTARQAAAQQPGTASGGVAPDPVWAQAAQRGEPGEGPAPTEGLNPPPRARAAALLHDHPTTPEFGSSGSAPGPGPQGQPGRVAAQPPPRKLTPDDEEKLVHLFAEAQKLGYDLVPHAGRPMLTPRAPGAPSGSVDDATQKVIQHAAGRLTELGGAGVYVVSFAGEPETAVQADSPEQAEKLASEKLGIRSAANPPSIRKLDVSVPAERQE